MRTTSLFTDQAPPISIPFRFFAVAPLFLVVAAAALAFSATNPFLDPHTPALLAATHCVVLGFMAIVMVGALHQILPVVVGNPMPAIHVTAWVIFLPLTLGAVLLPAGFLLGQPILLNLAWPILTFAFLAFIVAALISLLRAPAHNPTRTAILLAIFSLAGTVGLGVTMAHGYANGVQLPYPKLAAAHISLALGGWVMLLTVGVSYQVVPMFQLTPNYPQWMTRILAPAAFVMLLLNQSFLALDWYWFAALTHCMFLLLAGCFAVVTLRLQGQRRRRVADATLSFFRLGMVALLCTAVLALATQFLQVGDRVEILAAVIFVAGFAMSLIHGMLYKIVPFLVWFHLFRGGMKNGVPNMKEIIPEPWMWRHLWLHRTTLLAALLAPWWLTAARLVALGLLLQAALLGYAVFTAITVYRRTLVRLKEET